MPSGRGYGSSSNFGVICTCMYMSVARCTAEGTELNKGGEGLEEGRIFDF